jgi:hypothetical protein
MVRPSRFTRLCTAARIAVRCRFLLPKRACFMNWFDQSGMKAGLQQFQSCGKKPTHIGDISDYAVDLDAYY